mmetsp:Transcript_5943/g.16905  ORF Transcript_5943/g.16905 Transcript_5943/m.16905 type:complete len:80 (+) Transcript_5943:514-753(+)
MHQQRRIARTIRSRTVFFPIIECTATFIAEKKFDNPPQSLSTSNVYQVSHNLLTSPQGSQLNSAFFSERSGEVTYYAVN